MVDGIGPDARAGLWRRAIALLIDELCVAIPSLVLGAALFAATGGFLQWNGPGAQWKTCVPATTLPMALDPAPPGSNTQAMLCESYSFVGQVGRVLTVARITQDKNVTTTLSRGYTILNSGEAGGHDLSWVTLVAFLALLVGGEWRTGTTPGKRLLGLRVVPAEAPRARSVPLRQVAIRYAAAVGSFLVPFGIVYGLLYLSFNQHSGLPIAGIAGAFVLAVLSIVWLIWNTVRIVRRRPTVYDAIARVEVVRASRLSDRPPTTDLPGRA